MFGDQPEAADLGRNCELCRVELELDRPWCQRCTMGEISLWERLEKLEDKLGGTDRDVNTDGLVTTTSGMESSTGFRDAPQTIQSKVTPKHATKESTLCGCGRNRFLWKNDPC